MREHKKRRSKTTHEKTTYAPPGPECRAPGPISRRGDDLKGVRGARSQPPPGAPGRPWRRAARPTRSPVSAATNAICFTFKWASKLTPVRIGLSRQWCTQTYLFRIVWWLAETEERDRETTFYIGEWHKFCNFGACEDEQPRRRSPPAVRARRSYINVSVARTTTRKTSERREKNAAHPSPGEGSRTATRTNGLPRFGTVRSTARSRGAAMSTVHAQLLLQHRT